MMPSIQFRRDIIMLVRQSRLARTTCVCKQIIQEMGTETGMKQTYENMDRYDIKTGKVKVSDVNKDERSGGKFGGEERCKGKKEGGHQIWKGRSTDVMPQMYESCYRHGRRRTVNGMGVITPCEWCGHQIKLLCVG